MRVSGYRDGDLDKITDACEATQLSAVAMQLPAGLNMFSSGRHENQSGGRSAGRVPDMVEPLGK